MKSIVSGLGYTYNAQSGKNGALTNGATSSIVIIIIIFNEHVILSWP